MRGDPTRPRPFYVGYLPIPRPHALFLIVAIPFAVGGMAIGALGLARSQPAWGDGFWQTGDAHVWKGTLRLEPYPILHTLSENGSVETFLLVEMNKSGTHARFSDPDLDGAPVSIRGRELRRDGRRMIELDPDHPALGPPVAIQPPDTPAVRTAMVSDDKHVSIRGEIVDSKCYLGAMKPGAGRGHKACATLCIEGGIPPVIVSRDEDGNPTYHLLADNAGNGLGNPDLNAIKPVIGETVVLTGRTARLGSWRLLLVDDLAQPTREVPSASP